LVSGLQSNITTLVSGLQSNITTLVSGLQSNITTLVSGLQCKNQGFKSVKNFSKVGKINFDFAGNAHFKKKTLLVNQI